MAGLMVRTSYPCGLCDGAGEVPASSLVDGAALVICPVCEGSGSDPDVVARDPLAPVRRPVSLLVVA
ncbi:hypothetical protein [Longispora albida]|uniref:hypothetical protein n=1 Tax=Longispora albida TaxID=203523 RepID=UPI0012FC0091|nr:hypothetical protein [Longispora albida]